MTFWYVFGTDLIFSNFLYFIFYLGLITTPHALYVHMTYVYSLFLCFYIHTIIWPRRSHYCIMIFSQLRSTTVLWTHPHPHFLLLPPQPHHPYTPRLCRSTTAPPGEGYHPVEMCGHPEDPGYTHRVHKKIFGVRKPYKNAYKRTNIMHISPLMDIEIKL